MERDAYITDMYTQRRLQINIKIHTVLQEGRSYAFFKILNWVTFFYFMLIFQPLTNIIIVIQKAQFYRSEPLPSFNLLNY